MERKLEQVELSNLGGHGAMEEQLAASMEKIMDNIADPNTDAKALREITIKVKLRCTDDSRKTLRMDTVFQEKLAPRTAISGTIFAHKDEDGKRCAVVDNQEQPDIDFDKEQPGGADISRIG